MSDQKITIRYSTAFKQKIVSEIESGKLTIAKAKKIYDIKGNPKLTDKDFKLIFLAEKVIFQN